jgi:hypothetical protein
VEKKKHIFSFPLQQVGKHQFNITQVWSSSASFVLHSFASSIAVGKSLPQSALFATAAATAAVDK